MARQRVRWMAFAAVALLAGCVGPPAKTAHDPALGFDADTGSIDGLVVDEELLPLPGVFVVAFIDVPDRTEGGTIVADANGKFSFRFLPPAPYTVHANVPGHRALPVRVDVHAGARTDLMIQMRDSPIQVPHHKTDILEGHLGCAAAAGVVNSAHPCVFDGAQGSPPFAVAAGMRGVVGELVWERTLPSTSDRLKLTLQRASSCAVLNGPGRSAAESSEAACVQNANFGSATGRSPVTLRTTTFTGLNLSRPANLTWQVSLPGTSSEPDAGASFDQRFRIYSTVFYVGLPPEKFTAIDR